MKIGIIQSAQSGVSVGLTVTVVGLDFKYTSIDPLKIPVVSPKASVCTVSLIADTGLGLDSSGILLTRQNADRASA